jgi:enediyne biosynthesis protein E4
MRTPLNVCLLVVFSLIDGLSAQSFQAMQAPQGISGVAVTMNGNGIGCCTADFDGDGDMDIVLAPSGVAPFLYYRNDGGFVFADVSAASGLGTATDVRCMQVADVDNDGDADLYVGNDEAAPNLFINNGNGTFVDFAYAWGLNHVVSNYSAGFGDYDRDGWLDLYIGVRTDDGQLAPNLLYHNLGGTFLEVGASAGVDDLRPALVAVFMDYDEDGWPDILVANDKGNVYGPNELFRNNGDGTFMAVGPQTNTNIAIDGMGIDFLDVFNDGGVDFYMSDLPVDHLFQVWDPVTSTYLDATATYGLQGGGVGWATNFLDYDNDGWQDLHVVQADFPNLMYRNPASPASASVQWPNQAFSLGLGLMYRQFTAAMADFDNDGRVDMLQRFANGPAAVLSPEGATVYQNQVVGGNWIKFKTRGTVSNRDGFGAAFEVLTGTHLQRQSVRSGVGYQSNSDPRLHFGLGTASQVDQVKVTWPSGHVQYLTNLSVNQILEVEEPKIELSGPATVGGTTNLNMSVPGDEGLPYLLVLSLSNIPQNLGGGVVLPVQIDGLTTLTMVAGNPVLPNTAGVVDPAGQASSSLSIPPLPWLAGLTIYATGVTADTPTFPVLRTVFPSALPITIQ